MAMIIILCAEKKQVTAATVNGKAKTDVVNQIGTSVIGDDRTEVCHCLSILHMCLPSRLISTTLSHTLANICSQSDMPWPFKKSKKEEKLHVDRIEVIVQAEWTTNVYFTMYD